MKLDEFAFFNQQLAAMLRDGIPLEGALRRLCQEMRAGSLRTELQALEADLANGTPIADALKGRQLPELYKRMIMVGVKSGDLPGALNMLADYLQRQSSLWTRLKGLMIYPCIVLFAAFYWPAFCLISSARFFGGILRFSPTMLTCRRFGLACGWHRSFSDWRCWRHWSRFPFRRYEECCAGACQPSRKPAWHKSHQPWD